MLLQNNKPEFFLKIRNSKYFKVLSAGGDGATKGVSVISEVGVSCIINYYYNKINN